LVLEVHAYAADEAEYAGPGRAVVIVRADGSVPIAGKARALTRASICQGGRSRNR